MAKHTDPRPTHHKIAARIRADIISGNLAPGEQLPKTSDLMEQFGVASQTLQRALQLLKAEGFIYGLSGRGVFVRPTPLHAVDSVATMAPSADGEPYAWIKEATKHAKVGTNQILEVAEVVPPAEARAGLELGPDETAAMRYRLLLLDGEPSELVWSYYPMGLARGTALLERKKIKGGSPTLLAGLGHLPGEMVDRVSWRAPTEEEFVRLELPTEVAVAHTLRVVYSKEGRPIEATVMVKAGHMSQLLYRVQLP